MVKLLETTGPQIVTRQSYMPGVPKMTNQKLRRMRKDPVIALVRAVFFAGVLSGEWSYEGENDDHVEFIKNQFDPMRRHILATGALGCFDYGYQAYEKIFDIDTRLVQSPADTASAVLKKLKPLIQDNLEILTVDSTGQFDGVKTGDVILPLEKCLLLNFDVEGTDWKGTSTLENAERAYDDTMLLSDAAKRFDKKMAGAHWLIRYPDSFSTWKGAQVHNSVIADAILQSLQSSGSIAIPISQTLLAGDTFNEKLGWHIELITAEGSFPFADRFEYLDKCKARALGFPERSILEGNHGTLAEADAHQDFVITMIEYRHDSILEQLNWHCVNQVMALNYGAGTENTVKIVASRINDSSKLQLKEVYMKILDNPDGLLNELTDLDVVAMSEALGLPRLKDDANDDSRRTVVPVPLLPIDPVTGEVMPQPQPQPLDPAATEPAEPAATDIQQTALNGSQVTSLLEIVTLCSDDKIPKEVAKALIAAAFPLLKPEQISAIIDPLVQEKKAPPPQLIPGGGNNLPKPAEPAEPAEPEDTEDDSAS